MHDDKKALELQGNNRSTLKVRFSVLFLLLALILIGATAFALFVDYQHTKKRRQVLVSDLTNVVERNLRDVSLHVETLIDEVGKSIVQSGGVKQAVNPRFREQLNAYCRSISGCTLVGVITPEGQSVAVSGMDQQTNINVVDRIYFKKAVETRRLYIGAAILARIPGQPIVFSIAKPIYDASGKLLAVIAFGMDTNYLTAFYRLMGFNLNPTVSIFKGNGEIVARNPDMGKNVGKSNANGPLFTRYLKQSPHGVYDSTSILDGKKRIAAYSSIPELDLVVFVGIETTIAFNVWRERVVVVSMIMAVVLIIILAFLFQAYRIFLRQTALLSSNVELGRLSRVDDLTNVANRRAFDEILKRDWAQHQRSGKPLSILMLDIDFFKQYNDLYGHQAGDECLKSVAQTLTGCVQRQVDLVARYGGEEFAVVVGADHEGALIIAQRMCRAIENLKIAHSNSAVSQYVTISIGLASYYPDSTTDQTWLLKSADEALYKAKLNGRNRVWVA